jgi:hypothetical protein
MRKMNHLSFLKNHIKGDRRTLLSAWGVTMLDRHMLPQNYIMVTSHASCAYGATMLKQEKKVKFTKVLEDEVASDQFGPYSLL